jgi:hypothetical protein
VNLREIFTTNFNIFFKWRKAKLVKALIELRDKYLKSQTRVNQLEKEITQLKEQLEKDKIKATNKEINKPSSKQAEWEKGGSKKQDKGKKKRRGRKQKSRKGAGNRTKNKKPNQTASAAVEQCDI